MVLAVSTRLDTFRRCWYCDFAGVTVIKVFGRGRGTMSLQRRRPNGWRLTTRGSGCDHRVRRWLVGGVMVADRLGLLWWGWVPWKRRRGHKTVLVFSGWIRMQRRGYVLSCPLWKINNRVSPTRCLWPNTTPARSVISRSSLVIVVVRWWHHFLLGRSGCIGISIVVHSSGEGRASVTHSWLCVSWRTRENTRHG